MNAFQKSLAPLVGGVSVWMRICPTLVSSRGMSTFEGSRGKMMMLSTPESSANAAATMKPISTWLMNREAMSMPMAWPATPPPPTAADAVARKSSGTRSEMMVSSGACTAFRPMRPMQ